MIYVPGSASRGGVYDAGTHSIVWDLGTLEAGGSVTLTYSATVSAPAR
jgi:hypothetical protein